MTQVIITDSNGNAFTFQESDINKVKELVTSEVDHMAMPLGGAMQAFAFDFSGVTKRISISGVLTTASTTRVTGYSITTIKEQKQWLESLQTGNQSACTFSSEYADESTNVSTVATAPYQMTFTNTQVFVEKIEFNEEAGNPLALPFTMDLIVATGL